LTDAETPVTPASYTPNVQPQLISNKADVYRAISDDRTHLLDALPAGHYAGEFTLYSRPGHIPSARNVPTTELSGANGRLRPADELQLLIDVPADQAVITYCGGGVAASGLAFAAHRAGIKNVSVYMNSLQEWSADAENPMVLGTEP
jgi:thiosulfate/3-mercaptopyruvate sulfurtransferase